MDNLVGRWKRTTGMIYKSVLVAILSMPVMMILIAFAFFNSKDFLMSGTIGMSAGVVGLVVGTGLVVLVMLVAYIFFIVGLWNFRKVVHPQDKMAINMLFAAIIFQIISGILIRVNPLFALLSLIAAVLYFLCFAQLMSSQTFPAKARTGAALLFWGMIGCLIGMVIAFAFFFSSPFGGMLVYSLIVLISLVLNLVGWRYIAKSDAPVLAEAPAQADALALEEEPQA